MSSVLTWIEAKAWEIAAVAAGILCVFLLLVTLFQRGEVAHAKDALTKEQAAHALVTADLKTCKDNTNALQTAIDLQNTAVAAWKAASDAKVSAADKAATVAQRNAQAAQTVADMLKNHVPVGNDVCSRVLDSDAQFVESLK